MDTELMDTEVTLDQQVAPGSTTARPAEEFGGHYDSAKIEQILQDLLDDHAKNSEAITDAPPLAEGFAGIVYFAAMATEMATDGQSERQPTYHRTAAGASGAESVCSTRGRRIPTRPWRLPAVNRNPKSWTRPDR